MSSAVIAPAEDLEAGIVEIDKYPVRYKRDEEKTMYCWNMGLLLLVSIMVLPFGICSVYYAYTDDSCVDLKAGKLYVTLKDYLAVDGIIYLILYVVIIKNLMTIFNSYDKLQEPMKESTLLILKYVSFVVKGFLSSWLIVGATIFWKEIDNDKCNDSIYNYVYASLVIKIVHTIIEIISNTNRKKR